jgi:predicted 3-demethylubiquinone-9 3-methyltransferase (glyoxalase superfamily)
MEEMSSLSPFDRQEGDVPHSLHPKDIIMPAHTPGRDKIMPCLWFDDQAQEAAHFYVSVFKNSRIVDAARYGEAGQEAHGKPPGSVMTVEFELDGRRFMGLNGGPHFTFSPAISFSVDCATQEEVDDLWAKLSEGGAESQCGWLQDRYGVSWQIVPRVLGEMLQDEDREKAARVMNALLRMVKIDIPTLQAAYDGEKAIASGD